MTEPVLFLPGIACTSEVWRGVALALRGQADMELRELPVADSVDQIAAQILAQAPKRFSLAGHSMGGYVALAVMAAAPERVSRLALISTGATADPEAARPNREALIALAEQGRYDLVPDRLAPFMLPPDRKDDAALLAQVRRMARECGAAKFISQQRATMARPDRMALLPAIAVPTLVAVGALDRITPPALSRSIAAAVPGARLHEFAATGHLLPIENPTGLAEIISAWLQEGASP